MLEQIIDTIPKIEGREFYMWGAGNTSSLAQEGLDREESITIKAYIDSNVSKQGKKFFGKTIISPDNYFEKKDLPILIGSTNKKTFNEIEQNVKKQGGMVYSLDSLVFSRHKEELEQVCGFLEDDYSRQVYLNMVSNRIKCELPDESLVEDNQYFCGREFSSINPNEIFVDCGAYVGDSIERYISRKSGVFGKIIAFEPDSENYKALTTRINRLRVEWNINESRIETFKAGIGDSNQNVSFETNKGNNGLGSKVVNNASADSITDSIGMVTLDSFFENKREQVTFLKADIESYEYRMLLGAKKIIKEQKPKLAVCIYHNATDMYSIPLLVKALNPEYRLKVRQHSYGLDETVLYAY